MNICERLYDLSLQKAQSVTIDKVSLGVGYTAVKTSDGEIGVSYTYFEKKPPAPSALDKTVLVLGFSAERISRQLGSILANPKLLIVTNGDYKAGMAKSISAGMARIDESFDSAMIILGDFPLLNSHIIDQVLQAYRTSGRGICLPVRDDRWGHPICLSRRFFDSLMQIEGDTGAREIIKRNWSQVYQFNIGEDGCFFDVDTQQDMEHLTFKKRL